MRIARSRRPGSSSTAASASRGSTTCTCTSSAPSRRSSPSATRRITASGSRSSLVSNSEGASTGPLRCLPQDRFACAGGAGARTRHFHRLADDRYYSQAMNSQAMNSPGPVPVEPKPAASVVLVRPAPPGASEAIEVYMIRRQRSMKFLGGFYAFPGGKVDPADGAPAALAREGWACDLSGLRYLSHFITPRSSPIRFTARFFLCRVPVDQEPRLFTEETSEGFWIHPGHGYRRFLAGEMEMAEPAEYGLAWVAQFHSIEELWAAHADGRPKFDGIIDRLDASWESFDWKQNRFPD